MTESKKDMVNLEYLQFFLGEKGFESTINNGHLIGGNDLNEYDVIITNDKYDVAQHRTVTTVNYTRRCEGVLELIKKEINLPEIPDSDDDTAEGENKKSKVKRPRIIRPKKITQKQEPDLDRLLGLLQIYTNCRKEGDSRLVASYLGTEVVITIQSGVYALYSDDNNHRAPQDMDAVHIVLNIGVANADNVRKQSNDRFLNLGIVVGGAIAITAGLIYDLIKGWKK